MHHAALKPCPHSSCLFTMHPCSFTYPSRPGPPVLKKFSLRIPHGATVALVGESGSGKSTVVALFDRFYEPDVRDVTNQLSCPNP